MTVFYAILMGILQGATEFLPISSSGHLALAHAFFGAEEAELAFDVALHLGTLLAILVYFREDFFLMGKSLVSYNDKSEDMSRMRSMVGYICLATIPGVLAGLFLGDFSEAHMRAPAIVATVLGLVGLLLLWGEKAGSHDRHFSSITMKDALIIGLAQAMAIMPGVSRSGITMTAGLFRGLNRQAVAKFSFLLSAPIIFGAGVYKLPEIVAQSSAGGNTVIYLSGFLSAALSGYLVIALLLRYIRTRSFEIFAYYRLVLAGIVYAALLFV